MFTGLIKAVGKVQRRGNGLLVEGCKPFAPLTLGESIAVDGVCLTVAELLEDGFLADVSEETLSRTTLAKKATKNEFVNLEPALCLSDRLGGHLVSGHVDGLGEVISIKDLRNSWHLEIEWRETNFSRFICDKASISLDGISLTVAGTSDQGRRFWIAVIPHTWTNTSLKYLTVGSLVNLEVDLMAKYAEKLLSSSQDSQISKLGTAGSNEITEPWLSNQGWN